MGQKILERTASKKAQKMVENGRVEAFGGAKKNDRGSVDFSVQGKCQSGEEDKVRQKG